MSLKKGLASKMTGDRAYLLNICIQVKKKSAAKIKMYTQRKS